MSDSTQVTPNELQQKYKQFIDLRYPVIEFASNLSKPDLSAVLPITPVPTSSVKNPARKSTRKPTR